MSKILFNQIKKAHQAAKKKDESRQALREKGVNIANLGDDDNTIEVTKMDTFFDIAKAFDVEVNAEDDNLSISLDGLSLFIEPECHHIAEIEGRTFKITN